MVVRRHCTHLQFVTLYAYFDRYKATMHAPIRSSFPFSFSLQIRIYQGWSSCPGGHSNNIQIFSFTNKPSCTPNDPLSHLSAAWICSPRKTLTNHHPYVFRILPFRLQLTERAVFMPQIRPPAAVLHLILDIIAHPITSPYHERQG